MTREEAWQNCLLLLRAAPPLMFIVMSFQAMPTNSLAVPSPSLEVYQCNKLLMRTFCEQKLFLHHYVLFQLAQLFIRGKRGYLFPKCWNWQICHTHQAFKLPLCTFSGKLRTFPMVKSNTIGFLLDLIQQYTPVLFAKTPRELLPEKELLSGHYAAYSEVASTCYTTRCTWLHYVGFESCWKHLAERLLVLQTCVSHHALVEDKTECCYKDQYKPKSVPQYVIVKVHNYIPRSHIVYIDTTGFLFMVR